MPLQITLTVLCKQCRARIAHFDHHNRQDITYNENELHNVRITNGIVTCAVCENEVGIKHQGDDRIKLRGAGLTLEMALMTGEN